MSASRAFMYAAVLTAVSVAAPVRAQKVPPRVTSSKVRAADSAFRALQRRGQTAMGVDQYTSVHRFDKLADGGRVELRRDRDDSAGVATIRAHLRAIKSAFERGDFSTPAFVHMQTIPGTRVMAARRSAIRYEVRDLARGAELRMRTADPVARQAIHDFMDYQRADHRAGGHDP